MHVWPQFWSAMRVITYRCGLGTGGHPGVWAQGVCVHACLLFAERFYGFWPQRQLHVAADM